MWLAFVLSDVSFQRQVIPGEVLGVQTSQEVGEKRDALPSVTLRWLCIQMDSDVSPFCCFTNCMCS